MTDREPVNIMGVIAFPEPDKSKRRIRFIDAEYNTLFYIPDGASIVMTRLDGGSVIRLCTYIDDYHTLVGSNHQKRAFSSLAEIVDDHAASRRLADAALSGHCDGVRSCHKKRSLLNARMSRRANARRGS